MKVGIDVFISCWMGVSEMRTMKRKSDRLVVKRPIPESHIFQRRECCPDLLVM